MRSFIPGILSSKIMYALPLVGSIWELAGYKETEPMKYCFVKNDINKLQSIHRESALLMLPPCSGIDNISSEIIMREVN